MSINVGKETIQLSKLVRWLGFFIDSKFSYREHVQRKVAAAQQAFYLLQRLGNPERPEYAGYKATLHSLRSVHCRLRHSGLVGKREERPTIVLLIAAERCSTPNPRSLPRITYSSHGD